MEIYSTSNKQRETYQVELKHSLLWEAALGIAAITNTPLKDTLEFTGWESIKISLNNRMLEHLQYVEDHNTWKALLQLLHQDDFEDFRSFSMYIRKLSAEEFRYYAIPYLGKIHEARRQKASQQSQEAIEELKSVTQDNPFFPSYIEFICSVDIDEVKTHLIEVLSGWLQAVIEPQQKRLQSILLRDVEAKEHMKERVDSEQFVEWATGGIQYRPEPSVHKVILIPQTIYRPWNVEADLIGAKVFYYPVSNESMHPDKKDIPNQILVQRYKALGDENRLKMLKLVIKRSYTLHELTEELNMSKTTVHHHMKLLKSARLVSSDSSGYKANQTILSSMPQELELFLGIR
ncbi:ArsR/SmtB family transcription factor [Pontibacillus yanchengensis]|uniref:ArsR family transcriptional regulator n=1 Tax=Pontibacillus yanchengensis Y32 TaxID=1385514 RepID=A0A0A2TB09_9BACI|nr:metalloregulator ArsR/SmtB family transcription factor [Pontibacillus yanchengensis]KGP71241.1 ArsR family transcriptional regulator [Pontibacillus yanchengensis Y32]